MKVLGLFVAISFTGILLKNWLYFPTGLFSAITLDLIYLGFCFLLLFVIIYRWSNSTAREQQRLLLESAIKSVADAVLIVDKRGAGYSGFRIVFTNDAFHKMSGFGYDETFNKNPLVLLQGYRTDKKKLARLLEAISNNEVFDEEIISYRKNGQPFWINLEVSPIWKASEKEPRFFVAIVKDINEQKISDDERSKLTSEIIQRNTELQEFTQVVSHNLRAPVANILGLISIMDYGQPIGEYNVKLLGHLKESASNIDRILVDLNEILQVKESVLESRQSFFLNKLINEVLTSFHLQIEQSGAKIEVKIDPENLLLHSVRSYFHSIVYNLSINAIKYRQAAQPLHLIIGAYQTSDDLIIYVKDNGLGMDLAVVREKMFKLYKRFHTHVEGKGMGLFLIKNQVERLGGKIAVSSKIGKGSIFRVSIPLENCIEDQPETTEVEIAAG